MAMTGLAVNQLEHLDEELETILTSFDTSYAWRYGNVKAGLRDLYEKAKRDQWNGTTQLEWDTDVDPERGILPQYVNPLNGYAPYERLTAKEKDRLRHGQVALQLSQFLHGEQGGVPPHPVAASMVPEGAGSLSRGSVWQPLGEAPPLPMRAPLARSTRALWL